MNDNIIELKKGNSEKKISMRQAAEILGIPYSTARRRIFDPKNNIGFYDYDGVYKVIESDVIKYMERCRRGGNQDCTQKNVG